MGEFASKGVAGAGLGLGIAGTALGVLNSNGNLLGGLFGGVNQAQQSLALNALAERDAKIAKLEAERYTDHSALDVRDRIAALNKDVIGQIIVNDKAIASLESDVKCLAKQIELREQIVLGKVNEVALTANNGLTALAGTVNCLQQTVNGITKTIVPAAAVCPQPMPQYNSWTAPAAPTSDTTT